MAAAIPGPQLDAARRVRLQLFNQVQKLEGEQGALRVEMNQKTLAQEQLLFKARLATQAANKQLEQKNALLLAHEQQIAQQAQKVDHLATQLNQVMQQKNALQVQLHQATGLHAQTQHYLQQAITAANQRIEALEIKIVSERVKAEKENRLNDLMNAIRRIDCKLSHAEDIGVGGGLGMIIAGTLVAGPFGFVAGVAAAVGGGAIADCNIKELKDERRVVEAEAIDLSRQLGKPIS